MAKKDTERKEHTQEELDKIKSILGEADFNTFMAFKTNQARKDKTQQAKAMADEMCTEEGGKYYAEYTKHDEAARAIWEKAHGEAKAAVGLVEN